MANEPLSEEDARGMVARLRDVVAAHVVHGSGNGDAICVVLDAMRSACWV